MTQNLNMLLTKLKAKEPQSFVFCCTKCTCRFSNMTYMIVIIKMEVYGVINSWHKITTWPLYDSKLTQLLDLKLILLMFFYMKLIYCDITKFVLFPGIWNDGYSTTRMVSFCFEMSEATHTHKSLPSISEIPTTKS